MAEDNVERKKGYAAMGQGQKLFMWVMVALIGGLCLRVAVGDLYYVSDHRSFVCSEFPCFQKGYAVRYNSRTGNEVLRYYCASHTPPQTAHVRGRDWLFERPNLLGTGLFVFAPGFLIYAIVKRRQEMGPARPKG